MADFGDEIHNDAFGVIGISHVQGRRDLFMIDYPQDHYVVLTIKQAKLNRHLSRDWVFPETEIIRVALSETQFARMISSPNRGEGVPCTLERYTDPKSGEFKSPKLEGTYAGKVATFAAEVKDDAKQAAQGMAEALAALDAVLAGGAVKKGDLHEVRAKIAKAKQEVDSNLGFVVQSAEEAINAAADNAKAEVNAHVDFVMTRLGEQALGAHLQAAIANGADPAQIGRSISAAIAPPEDQV